MPEERVVIRVTGDADSAQRATKQTVAAFGSLEAEVRQLRGVLHGLNGQVAQTTRAQVNGAAQSAAAQRRAAGQIVGAHERQQASLRRTAAGQTVVIQKVRDFRSSLASTVRSIARFTTASAGFASVGFAIAGAVRSTVGFDKAMRNVNSIAQLSERDLGSLSERVLDLSKATGQAPEKLAEGLYDLVSSGFDASQAIRILGASSRAATAGLTDTATSTKVVAAVLNAYELKASDAEEVSDILFRTVDRGVLSFGDLAQNLADVLPGATQLGVPLEEVGAAIATITKQGTPAALATTQISQAMVAFIKPSEGMKAAIEATGFESGEALIKAKGFQGALEAVTGATDGSKAAVGELFPEIRGMRAAFQLTGAKAKAAGEDIKLLADHSGATSKALSQQSKSVSYQWGLLRESARALAIGIGQDVIPGLLHVTDILKDPNLTDDQKWDQVRDIIVPALQDAFDAAANVAADAGPRVALAFVRSFFDAPALTQLLVGGWLLLKARSVLNAAGLLGRRSGAAYATGFASTASTTVAAEGAAGAAGGAAAGGAAGGAGKTAGGAAGGAAAGGLVGRGRALVQRIPRAGVTAAAVVVGLEVGNAIFDGIDASSQRRSKDLRERLKGLSRSTFNLGDIFGGSEAQGKAGIIERELGHILDHDKAITEERARQLTQWSQQLDLTSKQRIEVGRIFDVGIRRGQGLGGDVLAKNVAQLRQAKTVTQDVTNEIIGRLNDTPAKARGSTARITVAIAQALHQTGQIKGSISAMIGSINSGVTGIGNISMRGPERMVKRLGLTMGDLVKAVQDPTSEMASIVADALDAFGQGTSAAKIRATVGRRKSAGYGESFGGGKGRAPTSGGKAKGGMLPGHSPVDNRLMPLPGGRSIAMRDGEAVLTPERHQPEVNTAMAFARAHGVVPHGSIGEMFHKTGAANASAAFAKGGAVGGLPPGIVPIPGEPGESIHRSILDDVVALKRRYKLDITDGYAPTGHKAGGEHPKGLAIDVVPGPGGSWDLIDRLATWAEPSQNHPRKPFRWVGYTGDPGHGRGNHLHLSWGGGAGAIDIPTLPQIKITGAGAARDLAQAAVDQVRAAAEKFIASQAGDVPVGTSSDPGGDSAGKAQLKAAWIAEGGNRARANLAAAVAMAESHGRTGPGVRSPNPAGGVNKGPWQIWSGHPDAADDLRGSARAAIRISKNGTDWSAWEAYANGNYRQFLARGGFVGGIERFTKGGFRALVKDPETGKLVVGEDEKKKKDSAPIYSGGETLTPAQMKEYKKKHGGRTPAQVKAEQKKSSADRKEAERKRHERELKGHRAENRRKAARAIRRIKHKPFQSDMPILSQIKAIQDVRIPNVQDLLDRAQHTYEGLGVEELISPEDKTLGSRVGHSFLDIGTDQIADLTVANAKLGKLDVVIRSARELKELTAYLADVVRDAISQAVQAIKERRERERKLRRMKQLVTHINAEHNKKKPDKHKISGWQSELEDIGRDVGVRPRDLRGDQGFRKTLAKRLETQADAEHDRAERLQGDAEGGGLDLRGTLVQLVGTGGHGGTRATLTEQLNDLLAERVGLTEEGLRARLADLPLRAPTESESDQRGAELRSEQLKQVTLERNLLRGELAVLDVFKGITLPYLGGFDTGAAYIDRTGLAVLHKGERVDTAAQVSRDGGGETHVHLTLVGDASWVFKEIDARIDKQAPLVSDRHQGRRARTISLAPGSSRVR